MAKKYDLIEFILKEINVIQGEIILTKAIINECDEKVAEAFANGDIMKEIIALGDSAIEKAKYCDRLSYMDGNLDAYIKLLKELGVNV